MMEYVAVVALLAVCTLVGTLVLPLLSVTDIAMLFLVAVGLVASRVRRGPAVFAAVLSIALFDFFFVPPRFTFAVADLHYVLTFIVMLGSALTIGELAVRLRQHGEAARERERCTAELYAMSQELVPTLTVGELVEVIARHARQAFGAEVVVLLRGPEGGLTAPPGSATGFVLDEEARAAARHAFDHWQIAGAGAAGVVPGETVFVPLVAASGRSGVMGVKSSKSRRVGGVAIQEVLERFAGQAAVALERASAFHAESEHAGRG